MEGGPGHVDAVDGGEVGEFFEGGGFGVGVGGFDLAADFVCGFGDGGGFREELEAEGFDEIFQCALEEIVHDR